MVNIDRFWLYIADKPSIYESALKEDAKELFDECRLHSIPESIRYYVDYECFARNCELASDMTQFEYNNSTYTNASGV